MATTIKELDRYIEKFAEELLEHIKDNNETFNYLISAMKIMHAEIIDLQNKIQIKEDIKNEEFN